MIATDQPDDLLAVGGHASKLKGPRPAAVMRKAYFSLRVAVLQKIKKILHDHRSALPLIRASVMWAAENSFTTTAARSPKRAGSMVVGWVGQRTITDAGIAHRDGMLPWCDACGFTDTGLHRTELGAGEGKAARQVLERLDAMLRARCLGEHRYVQHGDGKPPWCEACGLTNIGLHSSDYEAEDHEPAPVIIGINGPSWTSGLAWRRSFISEIGFGSPEFRRIGTV
jgi:hypothetical protein